MMSRLVVNSKSLAPPKPAKAVTVISPAKAAKNKGASVTHARVDTGKPETSAPHFAKAEPSAAPPTASSAPFAVQSDKTRSRIWESATDEERRAGELMLDLSTKRAKSGIDTYFEFAEKWNEIFPAASKKAKEQGDAAVKLWSKSFGVSASTVYSILKTTRFYGRKGYESLDAKAKANGVSVMWTHLRIITDRLAGNKEARTVVEKELVQRQLTEKQLNVLIDERDPQSVRTRDGQATSKDASSFVASLISSLDKIVRSRTSYSQAIERLDAEFDSTVGQGQEIIRQVSSVLQLFAQVKDFIDDTSVQLNELYQSAKIIVEGAENKQAVVEKAAKIKEQVAAEKKIKMQQETKRQERVQLMDSFSFTPDETKAASSVKPIRKTSADPVDDFIPDSVEDVTGAEDDDDDFISFADMDEVLDIFDERGNITGG
jgi:hypothetical protein